MSAAATSSRYDRPAYRWYVLGLLTLVYTFNFVDRQILVILQEQIRAELGLMDWQLGMLSGLAFALFYSILGMPIAHASETLGRKRVVSVALALWSLLTALSGAVQNFGQLLLIRIGVGVGEAGGSPPSHSMISDIFPAKRRGLALSIFSMGVYFGYLVGYGIGGFVAEDLGWRWTFVLVGLPGVVLAAIVAWTLQEPRRGWAEIASDGTAAEPASRQIPGFRETLRLLWSRKSFRHVAMGSSLHSVVGYGVGNFMPSLLMRAHDMSIGEVGWRLALITGLGGALGVLVSGWLGDRLSHRDVRWYLWVPVIALSCALPLFLTALLTDNRALLFTTYTPSMILNAMWLGPCLAVTHSLVGLRQRAVASAVLFFLLNLIGLGLGPLLVGILSDLLRPEWGDGDGLRFAMISVMLVANGWAIVHYFFAARLLPRDLANQATS